MDDRTLLAQPHLTIVSAEPDFDLQHIAQIVVHSVAIAHREALEVLFSRLLAEVERSAVVAPKTLDLIGHTRSSASLLTLGDWMIDLANPATITFFRELADHEVLPRLGVRTLRLLGCNTAGTAQGRATIGKLGELLGLEVCGTNQLLHAGHYDAGGFRDCWSFLLVGTRELRQDTSRCPSKPAGDPYPRVLDLDALPAVPLGPHASPYPRRIASAQAAREILQLVRHREGAPLPGLSIAPTCELALPSATPDAYHVAHILLDGEFLRFYPDGMATSGIAFPVDDVTALCRIVATLCPDPGLSH